MHLALYSMHGALTMRYAMRILRCMEHFSHIWPKVSDLRDDLEAIKGAGQVPYQTVAAWKRRGRIPADYDFELIEAAKRRGHKLTLKDLALARRPQTEEARQ